ncbi:uncharacterized protein BDR25DRAFT_310828 [Lindgomyces ingoldianus]|uniref:Uncharacterized protein n=1 Tax=Lindgomyces ingoldianus TaxID=673940 RepID=A0ACB6R814_9PLEO|nr:uncharacterized protein BDR25DRAFT_310828 [Lindgomyces ingoldianus]KAF2475459.1 hypothetical protein BDR25DRAFT_310828 [Lindgomyces ingoldianus]
MAFLSNVIANTPKVELHVNHENTLTPSLILEIATRNQVIVPEAIGSLDTPSDVYSFHNLTSLVTVYKRHSYGFFSDSQALTSHRVPFPIVIVELRYAIVKVERELGMGTSLSMCLLQDIEPGPTMATLTDALPYKGRILDVGLDPGERGNPPSKFLEVFKRAKLEGFLVTCRWDIDQNNSTGHIRSSSRAGSVSELSGQQRGDEGFEGKKYYNYYGPVSE